MSRITTTMSFRSALSGSWYVTIPVLAFLGWLVLRMLTVYDLVTAAGADGPFIGTALVPGVVGLVVMGAVALLFLVLFSELGEASPGPSPWPPEE